MEEKVHFLSNEISLLEKSEILRVASEPYSDENWVSLAYSVISSTLEKSEEDIYMKEKDASGIRSLTNTSSKVKCCFHSTSYKSIIAVTETKEFIFFPGIQILGDMKVYTARLKSSDTLTKLMAIRGIIIDNLNSINPSNRFLLALVSPEDKDWQMAYSKINLPKYDFLPWKYAGAFAKVTTLFFDYNTELNSSSIKVENIDEVGYSEFSTKIRMSRELTGFSKKGEEFHRSL